jgi:RNA polymerase sigma-70 factor, ECF subfamily
MAIGVRQLAHSAGDEQPIDWRQVYERDFPRIYNYFRYRMGVDAVAEDLAPETFARAWCSRQLYDKELEQR